MRPLPLTTMILAAALLSLAAGRGHAEQAAETDDQAAIQGIWEVLWSEDGGRRAPHGSVEHLRFFFSADRLRMRMGEKTVAESAYVLDPNQAPKVLGLVTKGRKTAGIYRLEGDHLMLCLCESEQGRPTLFVSEPESPNDVLIALKRADVAREIAAIGRIDEAVNFRIQKELGNPTTMEGVECPLEDAIEHLGQLHNVKVAFDEEALEKKKLRTDAPVTIRASGIALHVGLRMILEPLGMTYEVREGSIVVVPRPEQAVVLVESGYSSAPRLGDPGPRQPLWVVGADGSGLRELVALDEHTAIGSPDWSGDGTRIAFDTWRSKVGETYAVAHVFVVGADGSSPRDLGPGAMPSWSPQGDRMSFCQYSPNRGVWIMNADGSGRRLIDASAWGSDWSPKEDVIAFATYSDGANLCLYNLTDGSRRTILEDRYRTIYQGFEFSPDGQWIAFKGADLEGKPEVAIVHTEGHEKGFRVLVPRREGPKVRNVIPTLAWTKGGKEVLASMRTETDPHLRLYLLDPEGKAPPRLLPGQDTARINTGMACSADGRRIVFSSRAVKPPAGKE